MLIVGRLLVDPAARPVLGWIRADRGRIAEAGEGEAPRGERADAGGPNHLITPAFIDAHTHLPQFDAVGCDGMPLLEWLDRVVYPAERWWGAGAWGVMTRAAIARLVREGTLGAAAWLTSHGEATRGSLDLLAQSGLRCVAGRVAMDQSAADDLCAEDRSRAMQRPVASIVAAAPSGGRVEVSCNPRFTVGCSEALLAEAGWLRGEREAAGEALCVQTHLAESREECERSRELFPGDRDETAVLDRLGLLGGRTLLAHCCHLAEEEWGIIAARKAVAVHCPGANVFLRSGSFDLAAAREHGVRIALGSDLAAGPDLAMPRVARAMIENAKFRATLSGRPAPIPAPAEAWRMITSGNADALGWPDAGRLEVGAAADLLVLRAPETWFDARLVGRLLYNWSPDLIEARVLDGRLVAAV